jgi:hypothetical protein
MPREGKAMQLAEKGLFAGANRPTVDTRHRFDPTKGSRHESLVCGINLSEREVDLVRNAAVRPV